MGIRGRIGFLLQFAFVFVVSLPRFWKFAALNSLGRLESFSLMGILMESFPFMGVFFFPSLAFSYLIVIWFMVCCEVGF